jgi:hypothetical protein
MTAQMEMWTRVLNSRDVSKRYAVGNVDASRHNTLKSLFIQVHCSPNDQSLMIKAVFQPWYVKNIPPKRILWLAACWKTLAKWPFMKLHFLKWYQLQIIDRSMWYILRRHIFDSISMKLQQSRNCKEFHMIGLRGVVKKIWCIILKRS